MSSKSYDRRINLYINGREVKNDIASIKKEMYKLTNEQARMTRGSDDYNKKTGEIRQLRSIMDEHNKKLRTTTSIWSKMKGLLPVAGIAAFVFQIGRMAGSLLGLSKTMEADNRRAAIVFGESLGYVEEQADKLAKKMGVTNHEFIAMATATGDLLIPLDFTRQQAAEMSVQLQTLTGALDEWTGGSVGATEISNILTKAMLGENEQLKRLGIAIRKDTDEYRDLVKQKIETTGATKAQAEAMATLELIQKKSADAQTAYNEEGNKLLRLEKEIKRVFRQKKEDLINYLNGPVKSEVQMTEERQRAFNAEIEILKRANFTQEERARKIKEINSTYGAYMGNLLDENATLAEIRDVQEEVNTAFAKRILFLKYEDEIKKVVEEQLRAAEANYAVKQKEAEIGRELNEIMIDGKKISTSTDTYAIQSADAQKGVLEFTREANQRIIDDVDDSTAKVMEKYGFMAEALGATLNEITALFDTSLNDGSSSGTAYLDKFTETMEKLSDPVNMMKAEMSDLDFMAELEEEFDKFFSDSLTKEQEAGIKAAQTYMDAYVKTVKEKEEERQADEVEMFNKNLDAFQDYASSVGRIVGEAFMSSEKSAADAAKAILFITLDSIGQYAKLMIAKATIGSLASAESIATFGAAGIAKAAVLTGLIEAALAAVKGIVSGFADGGYTPGGDKYQPAGIVHAGEWVASQDMVASPVTGPVIRALEDYRVNRLPGYADGGSVQQVSADGMLTGGGLSTSGQTENRAVLQGIYRLLDRLDREGVRNNWTYKDINTMRDGFSRLQKYEDDVTL